MLRKLWERYDQIIFAILGFILGFMARGFFNWLIQLPVIGWLFK